MVGGGGLQCNKESQGRAGGGSNIYRRFCRPSSLWSLSVSHKRALCRGPYDEWVIQRHRARERFLEVEVKIRKQNERTGAN